MSGAQIVPIFYKQSRQKIIELLGKINGVVFPGGGQYIDIENDWTQKAKLILDYAIEQNKQGNPYPVYGICLGHQLIAVITSNDIRTNVLLQVDGQNPIVNTVKIYNNSSSIFNKWTREEMQLISNNNGIFFFAHIFAVYEEYYQKNPTLNNFWNLVGTTTSIFNQTIISIMQAKEYPFYGTQFHPQKIFEWGIDANRTYQCIQITHLISNNFIQYARLNKNTFSNQTQLFDLLIYNFDRIIIPLEKIQSIFIFNEGNFSNNEFRSFIKNMESKTVMSQ